MSYLLNLNYVFLVYLLIRINVKTLLLIFFFYAATESDSHFVPHYAKVDTNTSSSLDTNTNVRENASKGDTVKVTVNS